jgi:hypothetical protein
MSGWLADPIYGCRLWKGRLSRDGYGPHRKVWEEANGPIPEGLYLDHRCKRPSCVAIPHLELVSQSENLYRKRFGRRIREKACRAGHNMFENGRRTPQGGLICLVCSGVKKAT